MLRLWRVFKIIEEFSSGAEDQLAELQEQIDELRQEKDEVLKENHELKVKLSGGVGEGDGDTRADGGA